MFSQFLNKKTSSAKQTGLSDYAKDFFVHSYDHICALAELFTIEVGEYTQVCTRRIVLAMIGGFSAILTYLALWALLLVYLWTHCCGYCAIGVFAGFHFATALIFIISAYRTKPGPLAPMTKEELKTDLTCIKLSLNENDKH